MGVVTELQAVAALVVLWAAVDLGTASMAGRVGMVASGSVVVTTVVVARRTGSVAVLLGAIVAIGLMLGGRADLGYRELPAMSVVDIPVRLVDDPRPLGTGWRVTVVVGDCDCGQSVPNLTAASSRVGTAGSNLSPPAGARVEVVGYGSAGARLRTTSAGEWLEVSGSIRPVGDRPWLRSRHVVGRMSLNEAEHAGPADASHRLAQTVRDLVAGGAEGFGPADRALYTGLVVGDDRFQTLSQQSRFRVAGLSHLLAVSGQNVAFVLLVVWPVAGLLGTWGRMVVIAVALGLFVIVTRAEPSVLRATACAALATWAHLTGRDRSGIRVLVAGVATLLVLDPFLVDSVGFQLSVGASGGILALAPAMVARMPVQGTMARMVVQPLAVTAAAQIGVSPLLVHYFGPVSLVSLPANLLVGWAAGAVMTLGLTAGVGAGLMARMARGPATGPLAETALGHVVSVVQFPTRVLLWWIDHVAAWTVRIPLPQMDGRDLVMMAGLVVLVVLGPRSRGPGVEPALRHPRLRWQGIRRWAVVGAMALVLGGGLPVAPSGPVELEPGCLWLPEAEVDVSSRRDGPAPLGRDPVSVLIIGHGCRDGVVETLIRRGVFDYDLVVAAQGGGTARRVVAALMDIDGDTMVLAPPLHRIKSATRVTEPFVIRLAGDMVIRVEPQPTGTGLYITQS